MAEWSWDPDDFAALWFSDAYDRFPDPLQYTSRFEFRDGFAAHRKVVHARYSRDERYEIQAALDTLGRAELRIEIIGGTSKHKNSTGPGDVREYRIVGARTRFGAVVMSQYGADPDYGPIRVRTFSSESLPSRLAASLPACPPGSGKPLMLHPDDLRPRRDGYMEDVARNTPREQYQRLVNRPTDGGGTAVLLAGPFHANTKPWNVLTWRDISKDGRYTEQRAEHITVRPTTVPDLTATFTTWIDRAQSRLADKNKEPWD
ncbi:ESX secretion-associated protein EspG [Nocardia arthritidis]|uniref:ESX secretion-associated protein EspG n=1 Tax=Nocardia arthritidis TaxID=228602 RepID=A0A6G9YB47_9NOCA|nr:ESX secretion-associated protein EspG [Nocardia arthritidis]QIS10350.1 ESX secretion-associated protein EspG [Nocardia arthritidis]